MDERIWRQRVSNYGNSVDLWLQCGPVQVGSRFPRFKTRDDEKAARDLLIEAASVMPPGKYAIETDYMREIRRKYDEYWGEDD